MRRLHIVFELGVLLFAGASYHDVKTLPSVISSSSHTDDIAEPALASLQQDTARTAGLHQKTTLSSSPHERTTIFTLGQKVEARYGSRDEYFLATVVMVHSDENSESYGLLYSSGDLEYSVELGLIRAFDSSGRGDSTIDSNIDAVAASFDIRAHSEKMMIGMEAPNGALQRYRLTLTFSGDPWRISERFCFVSGAEDDLCEQATAAVLHRYSVAFGVAVIDPTPATACEVLRQRRYLTSSTHQDLTINETLNASPSSLSSNSGSDSIAYTADDNPVRSWVEAARAWQTSALLSSAPTKSAATTGFDPKWPWDGRLGAWISEAQRAVFVPPVTASECEAGESRPIDDGEEKEDTDEVSTNSKGFGDSSGMDELGGGEHGVSSNDDEDDEGKWVEDLVAIALAPWAEVGVTAAGVDAGVLADPKMCAKATVGIDGEWYITRACNGGGGQAAEDRTGFVAPTYQGEEPWWRVRRRNAVLELLRDASALSRATTGVSLPTNLSVALCVSDCVTSAGEHARWTQDEPSSSGIGDDNSRSSSSSSSGSSSFNGSNIVSSDESSDTNSGRQNTAAKPSLPWRYRLPQTEALPDPINHHQEPPRPVGPVFALTACAGSTHVPFPVFMNRSTPADNLEGFDFFKATIKRRRDERPWHLRRPVAAWRGGTSGKSCWNGQEGSPIGVQEYTNGANTNAQNLERSSSEAADSFSSSPEIFAVEKLSDEECVDKGDSHDVQLNASALPCGRRALRLEAATCETRHLFDVAYSHMRVEHQLGCQALVYAEGHCGWADRGKMLLLSGSVLLWQETMCREWYTLLLQPWVHYVPVDYHFKGIVRAAAWALCPDNAASVAGMRSRLQQYADKVLSRRSATAYAAKLLEKYADAWKRGNRDERNGIESDGEVQRNGTSGSASKSGIELGGGYEASGFSGCPSEAVPKYLRRTRTFEVY